MSTDISIPETPFARTCQGANLLSKVLQHLRDDEESSPTHYQRAIQLHNILTTFRTALIEECDLSTTSRDQETKLTQMFTPLALCLSAELALYFNHSCVDSERLDGIGIPEQISIQNLSISSITVVCRTVRILADRINGILEAGFKQPLSPFICDCLYQAARNITLLIEETRSSEFSADLEVIMNALNGLGTKWHVASKS